MTLIQGVDSLITPKEATGNSFVEFETQQKELAAIHASDYEKKKLRNETNDLVKQYLAKGGVVTILPERERGI